VNYLLTTEEVQASEKLMDGRNIILKQLKTVIVGQEESIGDILKVFFAGGHCLLEEAPDWIKRS
jgi:hypothetical protein